MCWFMHFRKSESTESSHKNRLIKNNVNMLIYAVKMFDVSKIFLIVI